MEQETRQQRYNHRPPKQNRGIILFIIIIVLFGVIKIAYSTYSSLNNTVQNSYKGANIKNRRNVSKLIKNKKPISILLLGTDTGSLDRSYKGRTDTIMLVTVNPKEKKTSLFSIPRDTMVAIPGYENDFPEKINSVYTYTNISDTVNTISKYMNVPIDFYALVNMGGLEKLVNEVGGVTIKSPLTFTFSNDTAHETGKHRYKFYKGSSTFKYAKDGVHFKTYHKMNGQAALAFSRMRYMDPEGDYGRTKRQRMVITAILKQSASPKMLFNKAFMKSISSNVRTNLTFKQMMSIAASYYQAKNNVSTKSATENTVMHNGVSYQVFSKSEKQKATNQLRSDLELSHAKTGPILAGDKSKVTVPYDIEEVLDQ
ncbi:LCP family protein [Paucilactobacillus suebicus]|uniref:LytR family transcriptional regulator n=1 Tax=Paucilactobacillus suebicus DSM 5007 = KCTC 3549 TaxID=1423807 RepID=A0A0R1WB03_9LACO|nr:LCP family protein [Paucilactobacillus suebicus]KRM12681.1 LytR family transcriptional regulator [Paucilactobacillus suebicus DSM 5007 = KCTC 3549]